MSSVSVGKSRDQVGAERDPGRSVRGAAERMASSPRVPPLHALQDHVVAGLQRQMQMRHQPFFPGDQPLRVASTSAASIDDMRSRGSSGTWASSRRAIWPSVGRPGRSPP